MDEINHNLLIIQDEIDDVINNAFTEKDKKEFQLLLKKYNTSIPEILLIFLENLEHFTFRYNNLDLSKSNEIVDFIHPLSSKLKMDDSSSKMFSKYLKKITSIVFTKYKNDFPEITKPISELYRENIFFIEEAFPEIEHKSKKSTSFSRFKFEKDYGKSCSNFFMKLKKIKKIDSETLVDNFEIIFSIKKPNKKFQKINWIASIYQLKYLIKIMMNNNVIEDDLDYLNTIINCFTIKNKELTLKKLDARGESHTLDYQQPLLMEIFSKDKKRI